MQDLTINLFVKLLRFLLPPLKNTQLQQRQRGENKLQRPPSLEKEKLPTPTRLSSTTTTPPPLPPAKSSAKPFMQDLTINLL
jgi:hypothetical protein